MQGPTILEHRCTSPASEAISASSRLWFNTGLTSMPRILMETLPVTSALSMGTGIASSFCSLGRHTCLPTIMKTSQPSMWPSTMIFWRNSKNLSPNQKNCQQKTDPDKYRAPKPPNQSQPPTRAAQAQSQLKRDPGQLQPPKSKPQGQALLLILEWVRQEIVDRTRHFLKTPGFATTLPQ